MNRHTPPALQGPASRQRGAAAVELALALPLLLTLLAPLMFISSMFWHYTVAQKAAQDAARYLSTISAQEMRSPVLARAAAAVATEIAMREVSQLFPGSAIEPPVIKCGSQPCGRDDGAVPQTVNVFIEFSMFDTFFGAVNTGRYGFRIKADVTMRYAGH